jgi:hypothetical protein
VFCCSHLSQVDAAESLSESTLIKVKAATVYVKTVNSVGSGFLIKTNKNEGYIITNHHVVFTRNGFASPIVDVIFDSGAKTELRARAKIIGYDKNFDLAMLKITLDNLPTPLKIKSSIKLRETMPLFMFGFPFGDALAAGRKNPEVTVSTGSISSLRKNIRDQLEVVQINGDLNPGNSGGPVVTSKGELVGVAVTTIMGTQVSQAVPYTQLEHFLHGYANASSFKVVSSTKKEAKCKIELRLVDPLNEISSIYVYYGSREKVGFSHKPDKEDGTYSKPINGMKKKKMTLKDGLASLELTIKNEKSGAATAEYYLQFSYYNGDRKKTVTYPSKHTIGFSHLHKHTDPNNKKPGIQFGHLNEKFFEAPVFKEENFGLDDTIQKLPSPIANIALAGSGSLIVVRFKDKPILGVYSIIEKKFIKFIKLVKPNFIFAAGGDIAVIYTPEIDLFSSYNLYTGKKVKTKKNPHGGRVLYLMMGHKNPSAVFVRTTSGTDALSRCKNLLMSASSFAQIQVIGPNNKALYTRNGSYRDFIHWRCNATMQLITEWCTSHSPTGFIVHERGDGFMSTKYEHSSYGGLLVGDDGFIYTTKGAIYDHNIKPQHKFSNVMLFPAIGGGGYLSLNPSDGKMNIYLNKDRKPVFTIDDMPYLKGVLSTSRDRFNDANRLIYNPKYKSIIMMPKSNDKIIQRGFDLFKAMDRSGQKYIIVNSEPKILAGKGKKYEYQIIAKSSGKKLKYSLEFGPEGMNVTEKGLVTWTVKSSNTTVESVIIIITDETGKQVYYEYKINVNPL